MLLRENWNRNRNLIWEIFKNRRLLCLFMHILLAVEHILTSVITSLESLLGIWNVITSEAKKSPIYILNYFTTFLSFFFFFSKLLESFTMLGLPSIIYFPTARDLQQDSSNKILKKRSYSVAISSSETNEVWRES